MIKLFTYLFLINIIYLTPSLANDINWSSVGENKISTVKVFIDKSTIRSSPDAQQVVWWQLDSYESKMPTNDYNIYSNISKSEGDCLRDRRKDLSVVYYDQKMGKGNKVLVQKKFIEKWIHDEPDSINFKTLRIVCTLAEKKIK
tara:strand:+ start:143 stop:574 length:432 start_codon:yes stop_codon:yes gene_type:complete